MKKNACIKVINRQKLLRLILFATGFLSAGLKAGAQTPNTNVSILATNALSAEAAWDGVEQASKFPDVPESWKTERPTPAQVKAFYLPVIAKAADTARDFYQKYPTNSHSAEAKEREYTMLKIAVYRMEDTNNAARLEALQKTRLNDDTLSSQARAKIRLDMVAGLLQELPEKEAQFTNGIAALKRDFPDETNTYQLMAISLDQVSPAVGKMFANDILSHGGSASVKEKAEIYLKQSGMLGQPLDLHFTAFDGTDVNLAGLKGKVVLVDFWATWCQPCMMELPNVKAAYTKLHGQGFEIIGISFDEDKTALTKTLKEKEMSWPQYFDGKGWENKYGKEFGIRSIPSMWLIGKDGTLRDLSAGGELEEKAARLLAEK